MKNEKIIEKINEITQKIGKATLINNSLVFSKLSLLKSVKVEIYSLEE